jgi:hypothetical protein
VSFPVVRCVISDQLCYLPACWRQVKHRAVWIPFSNNWTRDAGKRSISATAMDALWLRIPSTSQLNRNAGSTRQFPLPTALHYWTIRLRTDDRSQKSRWICAKCVPIRLTVALYPRSEWLNARRSSFHASFWDNGPLQTHTERTEDRQRHGKCLLIAITSAHGRHESEEAQTGFRTGHDLRRAPPFAGRVWVIVGLVVCMIWALDLGPAVAKHITLFGRKGCR